MSGAEAMAVLGVISSAINLIEASQKTYDAATNPQGLHDAFRKVAETIPLVINTLHDAERIQRRAVSYLQKSTDVVKKQEIEDTAKAVMPIVVRCQENAQMLQNIFEGAVPGDDATRSERYRKAVQNVMPGRKRKVEELMKEILEKLQVLHTNHFFKTDVRSADLRAAINQLSKVPSSLPDNDGHYHHFGSGPMNVHAGSGIQRNYTNSGVSAKMFNAETQNFGTDDI